LTPSVATVAGQPIPVDALDARIARMRSGPRGRHMPPTGAPGYAEFCRWVVRELVTETIISHEINARGLRDVSMLVVDVTGDVVVAEEDIRSYYERNPDLYRQSETVIAYEAARESIEAELLVAARVREFDLWLEERRRHLAVVAPGYEHPADPRFGFPSHRH
jgi:[acyl-carrier-protein] S-malonyltransferase